MHVSIPKQLHCTSEYAYDHTQCNVWSVYICTKVVLSHEVTRGHTYLDGEVLNVAKMELPSAFSRVYADNHY